MISYTLQEYLRLLALYLNGERRFSDIREFVFEYFEAEKPIELDKPLENVFPVLLPYLQFEEAEKDQRRDVRMRRIHDVLKTANSFFAERAIFGLEYDEIQTLLGKFIVEKVITKDVFERKMAELSPAPYDVMKLIDWAKSHQGKNEPDIKLLG
jgi:hypothetical protein